MKKTIFNYQDYVALKNDMSDTRADCSMDKFIEIFEVKGLEYFYVHELRFIINYIRSHKGLPHIPISGNKDDLLVRCNKVVYMENYSPELVSGGRSLRAQRNTQQKAHIGFTNQLAASEYEQHIASLMRNFCQTLNQPSYSEKSSA